MKRAFMLAAVAVLAAAPAMASVWLDAATPVNWNIAGASLPHAPGPKDADLAPGGRCAAGLRPPSTPEDHALLHRGWSLVGPYERFGSTSIMMATSSADGMCRPNGYQGFVFVNNVFAGTLSPNLMNARTDASIAGLSVELYNARDFSVTFARYADSDALCCPHASTLVSYGIVKKSGKNIVTPTAAQTMQNPH